MTKVQIKAFMTVAKEKSFTRAANVLYISQPAISKSISTLEDELGFHADYPLDRGGAESIAWYKAQHWIEKGESKAIFLNSYFLTLN